MGIRRQSLAVTTDGSGNGSVATTLPISGLLHEIRVANGGTATYTFTRGADGGGGTVAALSSFVGPASRYPRADGISSAGTAVGHALIPVDGHLTMTIGSGAATTAHTVHVYYDTGN